MSRQTRLMKETQKANILHALNAFEHGRVLHEIPQLMCIEDCFAFTHSELQLLYKVLKEKQILVEHNIAFLEAYFDEFNNPF